MFGRKNWLFRVYLLLLPIVTVSTWCRYIVHVSTGSYPEASTDDKIMIQLRRYGSWIELDNPGIDDFEYMNTDMFKIKGECVDNYQQTSIGSRGHAGWLFGCNSNKWLLRGVVLTRLDRDWVNVWETYTWLSCRDKLVLIEPIHTNTTVLWSALI